MDDAFAQLRTSRLYLRRFRESDVEAFARYRSDPAVARYPGWDPPYPMGMKVAAFDPFQGYKTAIDDKLEDAVAVLDAFHIARRPRESMRAGHVGFFP